MYEFQPYLDPNLMNATFGERVQRYPLQEPYGFKEGQDFLNSLQVRARPGDPYSPFVWGWSAVMLVAGGHATKKLQREAQKKAEHFKARKAVTNGYEGREEWLEPSPAVSDLASTGTLLTHMLIHGFTREEAWRTFERFPEAGGAYFVWNHRWSDPERVRSFYESWADDFIDEDGEVIDTTVPSSISTFNPWKGKHKCLFLPNTTTGHCVREKLELPQYIHPTRATDIHPKTVERIIDSIRHIESPLPFTQKAKWTVEGEPVAIQEDVFKAFENLRGKFRGMLADGYLPWLIEQGIVNEFTDNLERVGKGRGRKPKAGYRLAEDWRDKLQPIFPELVPIPEPTPEPEPEPVKEPSRPATKEEIAAFFAS